MKHVTPGTVLITDENGKRTQLRQVQSVDMRLERNGAVRQRINVSRPLQEFTLTSTGWSVGNLLDADAIDVDGKVVE